VASSIAGWEKFSRAMGVLRKRLMGAPTNASREDTIVAFGGGDRTDRKTSPGASRNRPGSADNASFASKWRPVYSLAESSYAA